MVDRGINSIVSRIGIIKKCSQCNFSSSTVLKLKRHEKIHYIDDDTKLKNCFRCDYAFVKTSHLKRHEMTHLGEMPYKCNMCDYASTQNTNLKRHINEMHTKVKPNKPKSENRRQIGKHNESEPLQKMEKDSRKLKHCDYCDYTNISGSHVKRHEMTHTGEMPHMCKMCDYASTQATNLKRHITDMHTENKPKNPKRRNKKETQCSECDYSDISGTHLKRHELTHTGEMAHKCNMCDYESTQSTNIKRHIDSIHTGNRPKPANKRIQCLKCDYAATSVSKLKEHNMTHTGEMPHKCNQCDFASARERNLRRHMETHGENKVIHTGNRPKPVKKPIQCLKCDYAATSASKLKEHNMTHTGEMPHKCNQCDFASARERNLRRHMEMHGENRVKVTEKNLPRKNSSDGNLFPDLILNNPSELMVVSFNPSDLVPSSPSDLEIVSSNQAEQQKEDFLVFDKDYWSTQEKSKDEEKWKCSLCSFDCVRETDLKRHMKTHIDSKLMIVEKNSRHCWKCKYSTSSLRELVKHLMTHPEVYRKVKVEKSAHDKNKEDWG